MSNLFDLAPVQLGAVRPGVGIVLAQGPCEIVVTVECGPRAKEDVVVLLEPEHGVDGVLSGHADRRGRQAPINICVVGRRIFQMLVEDAPQSEILHGVFHRGIGLQGNMPDTEARQ